MIENYKVGDMARYGLDYESLKKTEARHYLLLDHRLRPDRPDERWQDTIWLFRL